MKTAFKMTLAAAAAALAMTSVQAASVSLYGSISTGVVVTGTDKLTTAGAVDQDRTTTTSMENAWYGDSIWGLTGEEELGNGWKVGFALENEFESDTSAMAGAEDNKLFDSMSYLWFGNDFVKVSAGNLGGILSSAGGDFDLVGGFDPLEAAYGNGGMGLFATRDAAVDNAIDVELTPIDGLKFSFQMSLEDNNEDKLTGWGQQDHYYGLGATYENGPLAVSAVLERVKYNNKFDGKSAGMYTVGASWDFDVIKPSVMYQHTENLHLGDFCDGLFEDDLEGDDDTLDNQIKTDSILLGATAPLGDGTLGVSAQYAKIKFVDSDRDSGKAWVFGVAYNYELSKRTNLYAAGVYSKGQDSLKEVGAVNNYQIGFGLNHTF